MMNDGASFKAMLKAFPGASQLALRRAIGAINGGHSAGGGLVCPSCGAADGSFVVDSRSSNGAIRRRRECSCGARFTTYERVGEVWETLYRLSAEHAAAITARLQSVIDDLNWLTAGSENGGKDG